MDKVDEQQCFLWPAAIGPPELLATLRDTTCRTMVSPSFTRRGGAFGAQKNGLKSLRSGKNGFGLHISMTKNPSTARL